MNVGAIHESPQPTSARKVTCTMLLLLPEYVEEYKVALGSDFVEY